MLKMAAASTALALLFAVTPAPKAEAGAAQTSYRKCMADANWNCLPRDGDGQPYIPNWGAEQEAYEQCYEAATALCATLPDAPGG